MFHTIHTFNPLKILPYMGIQKFYVRVVIVMRQSTKVHLFTFISFLRAQAFQSAYSSFVSWLRDTERKIQRDNQLKLEVNDLKSGLAYLKVRPSAF